MDKNTLSNYGWIVIAVLVLAVMIALATPFGQYVEQGVRSTTEGLFSTSQNAMNSAFNAIGVEVKDQTFEEGYEMEIEPQISSPVYNKTQQKEYQDLKTALDEAVSGDIVQLYQNVEETNMLQIKNGTTFDLNGKSLILNNAVLLSFGNIVDSRGGTGTCSCNGANALMLLQSTNEHLPIYDNTVDAYRLFEYQFINRGIDTSSVLSEGKLKTRVSLIFKEQKAYELLCNDDIGNIKIGLVIDGSLTSYISASTIKNYATSMIDNFDENKTITISETNNHYFQSGSTQQRAWTLTDALGNKHTTDTFETIIP